MENKIVFFSPMSLLDNTSGAAISVRSFLEAASAAGIQCETFTASLFDPNQELNLSGILGTKALNTQFLGKRFISERNGVVHSTFLTKSSRSRNFTPEEQKAFAVSWVKWFRENRPKVVMTYGGSPYTVKLQQFARANGAQIVFYLGNAEYVNAKFYQPEDIVLCPSNFLKQHYEETIGVSPRVMRTIMNKTRLDLDTVYSDAELETRRKTGFVTFMTPIPQKGLTLFDAIAKRAAKERPDIKFLVTEGRSSRQWLAEQGMDLTQRSNIWFLSSHEDVRSIYQRTSVLLVPSFWKEGFSRSIQEAQLSGIPVMGTRRGGTPEALNGGGILFDPPAECLDSHMTRPSDKVVDQWWRALLGLLDDQGEYRKVSREALEAASAFHPDVAAANAVDFFKGLL